MAFSMESQSNPVSSYKNPYDSVLLIFVGNTPATNFDTVFLLESMVLKFLLYINFGGGRNSFFRENGAPMIRSVPQNIVDDVVGY